MEAGIPVRQEIGFDLTPIDEHFLLDLVSAAEESSAIQLPRIMELDEEERLIVELLRSVGRRLTTGQILSEFSQRDQIKAESTTKLKLSSLVKKGVLTNRQDVRPAGYGLSEW